MDDFAQEQVAPAPQEPAPVEIDELKLEDFERELRKNQNLLLGVLAGLAAAVGSAVIWAVITVTTNYQIGWMAVGVGFAVGFAVRRFGQGIDKSFGYAGAALALFGCLIGNLLSVIGLVATQEGMALMEVAAQVDASVAVALMQATFSPMDLLFYGIAVYEGYRFSFRVVSENEVQALLK